MRGDPVRHVRSLLCNFRLLDAAGACGVIAANLAEDCSPVRPPEWWRAVADSARAYRFAIHGTIAEGFSAIDEWSRSGGESPAELADERRRLTSEHQVWLRDVPGGKAYVAWLSAYVAIAELDGERALRSLNSCVAVAREFADVPGLGNEPSVYDFLQSAADCLPGFLPVPEHPVRDSERFAFLPCSLRSG
jgi:hypothetical protein